MGFKHVALIMDGNGRWAKAQNKLRTFGHLQGSEKVREIAIAANDLAKAKEVAAKYSQSSSSSSSSEKKEDSSDDSDSDGTEKTDDSSDTEKTEDDED